jgi:hypothetical protein
VGAYSATADIDLEVIDYDPAELPSGVASPYQTSYQLSVGDDLTFDPEELDFASGTVPDGLTAWKLIDLNDGDWDQVDQESAGGEAVRYAFNAPGRYILTLVVAIYNHICWQDVSIVVTDESGVMDPGIGYDQRFETLYLNGVEEDRLGDAHVDRAVVRPDSGETAEWSIIQTGDEGVAEVSIDPEATTPAGPGSCSKCWARRAPSITKSVTRAWTACTTA